MEQHKNIQKMNDFIVIGLGRFGRSVATTLFAMGKEVLAIDHKNENVTALEGKVSSAVTADACSQDILYTLGAQNFDCAIIAIGDNLESSLLTAQKCIELGVKFVIAKAQSDQHAKILKSLGVDLIIYPEEFVGKKLASLLSKPGINELVDLTDDFKIFEMSTPEAWQNKNVADLNIRKKYKVSIVFIKKNNKIISPDADTILEEGDKLIIAGESTKIVQLANLNQDTSDAVASIYGIFDVK